MNVLSTTSSSSDSEDFTLQVRKIVGVNMNHFEPEVNAFRSKFGQYNPKIDYDSQSIMLTIPSTPIPGHLRRSYGFDLDNILFNVEITFDSASWTSGAEVTVEHPSMKTQYIGRTAQMDRMKKFFSASFNHQSSYAAKLAPPMDDNHLYLLVCELLEPIFDSTKLCCICKKQLKFPVIKASPCSEEKCQFAFVSIGAGSSIWCEIHRDPLAADLVVSLFSGSMEANMKFMTPPPPKDICSLNVPEIQALLDAIPSMHVLDTQCRCDSDIMQMTGKKAFELLQWILLSNESNLVSIPPKLESRFSMLPHRYKFINLSTNPDRYKMFTDLKSKHGSQCFWHGSGGEKWHSIHRNGLKNYSGTANQVNGAVHGAGIYLAPVSSTSYSYSRVPMTNHYKQSVLGDIKVIALAEVCNVPELQRKSDGWCYTLTEDRAIIVRFLLVDSPNMCPNVQASAVSPSLIPTVEEVMEALK